MSRPLLSTLAALCALGLPIALHAPATQAADEAAAGTSTARVIVKLKADASVRRMQAQSVGERHASQAQALGARVGIAMSAGAGIDDRTQVMFANGMSSEQLAATLATDANVESVTIDQRRRRTAIPNDPLYLSAGGAGPATGQWYLRPPTPTAPASINAEAAWDLTTGSSSIVVAVLDTGVRFDHPDLARAGAGGNLLPGYDMISDTPTANDGGGRDDDPSDPGDWISAADRATTAFRNCDLENSSWHGTQTAGLIAATTNNAIGMASVGRTVRLLPVRVLGKCGGYDSDIQAGMRWAAGLPVPGVPANPNPARVINMSLGGSGSCGNYAAVVAEVTAAGAVVVASAGNSAGHAVGVPANCPGTIGVGGIRHVGSKVGFSDLGPEVAISAPAGNCVNTGGGEACLYPILTTSNSGTTSPVVGGSIYTDSFNSSLGTSFSAPLVAGTAALMLSVRPALTPAEVKGHLQATARPFPTTGASNAPDPTPVAACNAPMFDNQGQPIDQLQCYCTTTTCGAGMLDASAAVRAVFGSLQALISANPTSAAVGQTIALSGTGSTAPASRTVTGYQWSITSGAGVATFVGATNASTATLAAVLPGSLTVQLVVTDSSGATATSTQTLTVTALPAVIPESGGGGGGALGLAWLLALGVAVLGVRQSAGRR